VPTLDLVECHRCGLPTPLDGSPDWVDWQPSHEGGWLCDYCLTDEVKDNADLALLLDYESEMESQGVRGLADGERRHGHRRHSHVPVPLHHRRLGALATEPETAP
jgi:hypothetical protein